ncbi:MAG: serine/threonine-protein kinase [Vicinamibacterales bacterium]
MMPAPARQEVATLADGRYELRERLAAGATGYVFVAEDRHLRRQVAVKVIAADLEDDPEARERFFREASILAGLTHPNIVRVLDVGVDHGRPFMVMELIAGLPLGDYLRTHADLSCAARLVLITQLYEGLEAAHTAGAVHRDIKPGNIVIQDDGQLKILDFGLARLRHSTLTAHGAVVGSPGYMSPEQANGHRVDGRSDIFSAAAVGYFILTGRPPFGSGNLPRTLHAVLHDSPTALSAAEAPPELAAVLRRALEKSPDARYQTCAEILDDLRRLHSRMVES